MKLDFNGVTVSIADDSEKAIKIKQGKKYSFTNGELVVSDEDDTESRYYLLNKLNSTTTIIGLRDIIKKIINTIK